MIEYDENEEDELEEQFPFCVYVRCVKESSQINLEIGATYKVIVTEDRKFTLIQNEFLNKRFGCSVDFLDAHFECLMN